jgi:hypothetical protein
VGTETAVQEQEVAAGSVTEAQGEADRVAASVMEEAEEVGAMAALNSQIQKTRSSMSNSSP